MIKFSTLNINQENENKIIYLFDNNLVYIIVIRIIILIKVLSREEKRNYYFFPWREYPNILPCYEHDLFEVKNVSKMTLIIKDKIKFINVFIQIKENQIKKKRNIINNNNIIIRKYFIITTSIILNIFCQIKNNILNLFFFQDSKITLKIKGIGYNTILGNETNYNFKGINNLKEVNINENNENNQNKIEYIYYFEQTDNSVELIWDDNLNNCQNMFRGCSNITEIDLSNFNTSKVKYMQSMFYNCSSLTSLDFSNFNTSQVEYMTYMFYNCSSLTSLDLSNFNTSKVSSMYGMFYNCSSLISLNLSNFNTSQVIYMQGMFYNCSNLEYINLNTFYESHISNESKKYYYMFYNVPSNVVICINESITKNTIFPLITKKSFYVLDYSDDWKSKQKNIINNTDECIGSFIYGSQDNFEYNGKCFENCINVFLDDENNDIINKCKFNLDKCLLYQNFDLKKELCMKCNILFQ